jgi:predicted thioesterase
VPRTRLEYGETAAMKDSLRPGLEETRQFVADDERCISFMGDDLRVYATPAIVNDVEFTCRDLLIRHLGDGEDSVGMRVEIDHLAPTLMGMTADVSVEIAEVDKRKVTFSFHVRDAVEEVARGRHTRFVVDKAKTAERLAAKRDKAGA